ncbi:response regulator transcription factor [soil metagenome]
MQRILVIDDDAALTSTLKRGLAYEGYAVDAANSSRHGLTLARERTPDLVILDVMLPELDGFEVLSRLRSADAELPVLMLTARDEPESQVRGLECGADDYVLKPFTFQVLAARVKALLRRRTADRAEVLHFADLSLDTGLRRAQRGQRDIELTSTEYEVLRQFLLHPRRVLPKCFLMDRVWGYAVEGGSNVLEVYVKQLRQKLEAANEPRLIHTFRGAGYLLREPSAAPS